MYVVKMYVDREHIATFSVQEFEMDYRTMTFHCSRSNSEESFRCSYMHYENNIIRISLEGGFDYVS